MQQSTLKVLDGILKVHINEFLTPIDIILMLYSVFSIDQLETVSKVEITANQYGRYLKRINFDSCIEQYIGIGENTKSVFTGNSGSLLEISVLKCENDLGDISVRLENILISGGMDVNGAKTITSTLLGEIATNAIEHSVSKSLQGKVFTGMYAHLNDRSKSIDIIVFDCGQGFSGSLKANYPELDGEIEYIRHAIKAGVSGRLGAVEPGVDQLAVEGGIGLDVLQDFVIERYGGAITLGSNGYTGAIRERGKFDFHRKLDTIRSGVYVQFTIPIKNNDN